MLTIQLNPEVEKILARRAKRAKRTPEEFARNALLKHLEDLEDYEDAKRSHEAFIKSGKKATTLEEMLKRYGLDNRVRTARGKTVGQARSIHKPTPDSVPRAKSRAA
jgi:RHH-type rel operon transcriptional repressor/antitoxin RelB